MPAKKLYRKPAQLERKQTKRAVSFMMCQTNFQVRCKVLRCAQPFDARFLLHALTDDQITAFFQNCKKASKPHDLLMVEYRTEKDRHRNKVTPKHYRNYLSAEEIEAKAKENGFSMIFLTEGTGFAKWLDDDAYVARQIFYRN